MKFKRSQKKQFKIARLRMPHLRFVYSALLRPLNPQSFRKNLPKNFKQKQRKNFPINLTEIKRNKDKHLTLAARHIKYSFAF